MSDNSVNIAWASALEKTHNEITGGREMKQIWIYILATALALTGCDVGDRKAVAAMNKANAEAAKQCEAKLKGLKHVPIVGTGGKLFLVAERLPSWAISSGFVAGDECGASKIAFDREIFYWIGKEIIPKSVWLARGHSLHELQPDWLGFLVMPGFGLPRACINDPKLCDSSASSPPYDYPAELTVRLKKYELDYRLPRGTNSGQVTFDVGHTMGFAMRGWPTEDGKARFIVCSGFPSPAVRTIKDIEEMDFKNMPLSCQVDSWDFRFKEGAARINFGSGALTPEIVTALRATHQYLNDSIIQE